MSEHKEIKTQIQNHYNNLPKNQKKIADYFLDNFNRIPFLSVHDISEATSLSVASIVRFAQRIGYKGFLEMRAEIAGTLQNRIQNKEIFSLVDSKQIKSDTLTSVANQDIVNINETLKLIDRKSFNKTVKFILGSQNVYTAGMGISFLLAQILSYQLSQVAVKASNLSGTYSTFLEQILFMDSNDLLIALSFPPYSKETIEAAKFAKERKVKVVSITNRDAAPIVLYSDTHLVVRSENMLFTNSISAISVVINAITTSCAIQNQSKAKKLLNELNNLTKHQDNIIL